MLSGNVNSFGYFSQTICHHIRGTCSNWVMLSDTLSGNVNPFQYFPQITRHHIRGTCSTWKVFTDKRYHRLNENFIYLWPVFKMKENDWQLLQYFFHFMASLAFYGCSLLLWILLVYGKKYAEILATNFWSLFRLHCYSQVASIFTFISDQSV